MRKRFHFTRKNILILLSSLLILGIVAVILEKNQITNFYTTKRPEIEKQARTTSTAPTAQENFNDGDMREPGNTLHENGGSGGIVDNGGAGGDDVDTSNPTISSTGEITLYAPTENASITSGITVSGSSKLNKVSYRLIDNLTGVIATGELSVVNGKFSGNLNYITGATEGRLDIYGAKADGTEFSNIEIPLRFTQ